MVHEAILREVLLKCQDARAKAQGIASGNMQVCVANRKKGRVGRKIKYTAAQAREKLLQRVCSRLKFALNFMAPGEDMCEMLDYVHLDEKWREATRAQVQEQAIHYEGYVLDGGGTASAQRGHQCLVGWQNRNVALRQLDELRTADELSTTYFLRAWHWTPMSLPWKLQDLKLMT
ncbi:hypothetical protein H257_17641 [Aphanomyces astaci]|uniref:Uncharacterized protein n=1 Tax=Aphanomyces astaci TaxID=112090 RepID=W4FDZ7_APHAT|nr:hypothetical protein H257_17641 [Aphanomyces astaci]ETV65700.1 hypothetical protein H257_17641 [Aphanomyces astaci]|eukprot:XP_009844807.1 hypothetical protein H257_17641 [Aphanomyces astaci]